ncbi:hypothetical protein ACS5NO_32250 [Larkinella sp. GY13]|uniref:hypothetical protein n=1 Tax=Larkinella sp. GY13 TaxID=3453720 RepID=UPI003EEAD8DA
MKSFDANEQKFRIAQKYQIPESEIDESVLTLYILMDAMNEESKRIQSDQKAALVQTLNEIREFQAKKFQAITYEDPKTAFWGNVGSKGMMGVAVCLTIMGIALLFTSWYDRQKLVKNLEVLKNHVKVREDGYFIDQASYTVVKGGVLIKP